VRTINPKRAMPGRLTANARHLTNPDSKVYYLTMENGVYEVDVRTLEVTELIRDPIDIHKSILPGYHGKGAYTGSGRVVVSNNGEPDQTSPSGCLATWDGQSWTIVARNQFTEVTGPGGLRGNKEDDRVWSVGWDAKSVRLLVLERGLWSKYRLPKGSYTHDSNHGWNTEWPRIRQVKDNLTLMHMHGLFFDFPHTFSSENTAGLAPICTYVKMPVDYAWFNDKLVIGKDDASRFDNQFVQQAQSNLWVGELEELSDWGPKNGFGGVWLNDSFEADTVSEPFLINGFKHVHLHVQHQGGFELPITIQVDRTGQGRWETIRSIVVDKQTGYSQTIETDLDAQWIRLIASGAADRVTAYFHVTTPALGRERIDQSLFECLADVSETAPPAATLQLPPGQDLKLNVFAEGRRYLGDGSLQLSELALTEGDRKIKESVAIRPDERLGVDDRSAFVQFKDLRGKLVKLRLPKGPAAFDSTLGKVRHIREVVTERSTLNLHGTFYELPRPQPGNFLNFWQLKPISSHSKHIHDFCSWRGLLVFAGALNGKPKNKHHLANLELGLWLGEVDDLWKFGKPVGRGGPWLDTKVNKDEASEPYLMLGYERKTLTLSHENESEVEFAIEVDFLGTGEFSRVKSISVKPRETFQVQFPDGFSAHWVRLVPAANCTATATFHYE